MLHLVTWNLGNFNVYTQDGITVSHVYSVSLYPYIFVLWFFLGPQVRD